MHCGQNEGIEVYLGIATTFDIEDTMVTPAVLVIADESAIWISRQCGLPSP